MSLHSPVVGQLLSEEDVVVRPDGVETAFYGFLLCSWIERLGIEAFVLRVRNSTASITEVTVLKAFLDILDVVVAGRTKFDVVSVVSCLWFFLARYPVLVFNTRACTSAIVIALIQVEVVQVIGHGTVVELLVAHCLGKTVVICVSCAVALVCLAIAVDNLLDVISGSRITEDSPYAACRCTRGVNPAAFHIALSFICHTSASERTCDTEVIDITTEMTEQGVVQTTDSMTIAMKRTLEALICFRCNRCPRCSAVVDIRTQEELKVLAALNTFIQQGMSFESAM